MTAVIVAHGLWMPGWETAVLRRRLALAGFTPYLFRFPTVRESLSANADALARFADRVPGDELHFVGYSLGGCVTLTMLAARPLDRDGRVVCLGSPLKGSALAGMLAEHRLGRGILGKSMLELIERNGLPPWAGTRPLGVIAGSRAFGAGRLVGWLPPPNDGDVTVEETRLEGLADHLVLPVTHTMLMFSADVADATIRFLRHGRFG